MRIGAAIALICFIISLLCANGTFNSSAFMWMVGGFIALCLGILLDPVVNGYIRAATVQGTTLQRR